MSHLLIVIQLFTAIPSLRPLEHKTPHVTTLHFSSRNNLAFFLSIVILNERIFLQLGFVTTPHLFNSFRMEVLRKDFILHPSRRAP